MPAPDRLSTHRTVGTRPTRERAPAEFAHWERHGFGVYALCDRAGGTALGEAGLHAAAEGESPLVGVTVAIVPERSTRRTRLKSDRNPSST